MAIPCSPSPAPPDNSKRLLNPTKPMIPESLLSAGLPPSRPTGLIPSFTLFPRLFSTNAFAQLIGSAAGIVSDNSGYFAPGATDTGGVKFRF